MPAKKTKKTPPKQIIAEKVTPIARKINITGMAVLLAGIVLGSALLLLIPPPVDSTSPSPAVYVFQVVLWLYMSAILFRFNHQTGLTEYLLHYHLFWLTGVASFPVAFVFSLVTDLLGLQPWVPAAGGLAWPLMYFVARFKVTKDRWLMLIAEVVENEKLWPKLANLRAVDVLLMRFPTPEQNRVK